MAWYTYTKKTKQHLYNIYSATNYNHWIPGFYFGIGTYMIWWYGRCLRERKWPSIIRLQRLFHLHVPNQVAVICWVSLISVSPFCFCLMKISQINPVVVFYCIVLVFFSNCTCSCNICFIHAMNHTVERMVTCRCLLFLLLSDYLTS